MPVFQHHTEIIPVNLPGHRHQQFH